MGEANIVPPLATVANAVNNATGKRIYHLPLNPQAVSEALQK